MALWTNLEELIMQVPFCFLSSCMTVTMTQDPQTV